MARPLLLSLGLIAALASPSPSRAADSAPTVKDILTRAAVYIQKFEDKFSAVISIERYEQHAEQRRQALPRAWLVVSSEARTLRSEMILTRLADRHAWLTVRNVIAVDGRPVPDSADRLERALSEPGSPGVLRTLADEGARFNLGRIRRNVNDPTLALQFLERAAQAGFAFSLAAREQINGVDAWKLAFLERRSPSLIRGARNEDLPASGSIWLSTVDGAPVRTSLDIRDKRTRLQATSVVDYERQTKLDLWVPVRMTESYVQTTGNVEERIVCTATYSDFRRFETSGRLIAPQ